MQMIPWGSTLLNALNIDYWGCPKKSLPRISNLNLTGKEKVMSILIKKDPASFVDAKAARNKNETPTNFNGIYEAPKINLAIIARTIRLKPTHYPTVTALHIPNNSQKFVDYLKKGSTTFYNEVISFEDKLREQYSHTRYGCFAFFRTTSFYNEFISWENKLPKEVKDKYNFVFITVFKELGDTNGTNYVGVQFKQDEGKTMEQITVDAKLEEKYVMQFNNNFEDAIFSTFDEALAAAKELLTNSEKPTQYDVSIHKLTKVAKVRPVVGIETEIFGEQKEEVHPKVITVDEVIDGETSQIEEIALEPQISKGGQDETSSTPIAV